MKSYISQNMSSTGDDKAQHKLPQDPQSYIQYQPLTFGSPNISSKLNDKSPKPIGIESPQKDSNAVNRNLSISNQD